MVGGEGDIGFPAEAVGSEIFTHDLCFLSQMGISVDTVYDDRLTVYPACVKID
jgi:hypothetical protein